MIRANELRIGNLILKDGKVFSYAGVDVGGMYDGYIGASRQGGVVDFDRPEYFYGIPLTPEILIQWCGFRKDATFRNPYHSPDGKLKVFFQDEQYPLVKFKNGHRVVKYLHQFQNLVFALTSNELEIKIPVKA